MNQSCSRVCCHICRADYTKAISALFFFLIVGEERLVSQPLKLSTFESFKNGVFSYFALLCHIVESGLHADINLFIRGVLEFDIVHFRMHSESKV